MNRQVTVTIALVAVLLLVASFAALASTFSTIDFEQSEGYAAPQDRVWGTAQQNIGAGPDLYDIYYGNGNPTAMFTWTGVSTGYTGGWPPIADGNYGVPSGQSAFYYYGCWSWDYARTPGGDPRLVPTARQTDRYFTVDYNSLVVFCAPDAGNNLIPATMNFWFNGFQQNGVTIMHSKAGIGSDTYDILLNVNGTELKVGNYAYGQWADEKLVFDRVLGELTYSYNGSVLGTYSFPTLASWDNYGVAYYFGNRDGVLATDNLRFGTAEVVPEPSALVLFGIGLTGLVPIIRRRK